MAAQNGCELEYCLMCIGGCSFERHVRVAEAVDASSTNAPYQVASNMAAFDAEMRNLSDRAIEVA